MYVLCMENKELKEFIYGKQIGVLKDELTFKEFKEALNKSRKKKIKAEITKFKKIMKK